MGESGERNGFPKGRRQRLLHKVGVLLLHHKLKSLVLVHAVDAVPDRGAPEGQMAPEPLRRAVVPHFHDAVVLDHGDPVLAVGVEAVDEAFESHHVGGLLPAVVEGALLPLVPLGVVPQEAVEEGASRNVEFPAAGRGLVGHRERSLGQGGDRGPAVHARVVFLHCKQAFPPDGVQVAVHGHKLQLGTSLGQRSDLSPAVGDGVVAEDLVRDLALVPVALYPPCHKQVVVHCADPATFGVNVLRHRRQRSPVILGVVKAVDHVIVLQRPDGQRALRPAAAAARRPAADAIEHVVYLRHHQSLPPLHSLLQDQIPLGSVEAAVRGGVFEDLEEVVAHEAVGRLLQLAETLLLGDGQDLVAVLRGDLFRHGVHGRLDGAGDLEDFGPCDDVHDVALANIHLGSVNIVD
ncbi:hypothetical protein EYF80_049290 [Liparis tanakae]|uniref:Uncharacterized protein n=1 Tax=Liparis tanakae TaxID=230148 RepID=A0A4Z2FHY3_9TELE|nr:hypothetical protein EYF80_049290 [Liparis tanakae]